MKHFKPLFLFFCGLLIFTPDSVGQGIPGILKRKLNQTANKAADKAIEGAVERYIDKKLDEIFGLHDKNVEIRGDTVIVRDSIEATQTIMVSEEPPADPEPSSFIGEFTYRIESYKKDKMEKDFPIEITYHIDKYAMAVEIYGQNDATLIVDRKARTMTTKVDQDGDKQAIVMPLKNYKITMVGEAPEVQISETGNTKEINGYNCKEFLIDDGKEVTHAWLTNEVSIDFTQMQTFAQLQNRSSNSINNLMGTEGVVILSESVSEKKNTRRTMEMTNYKEGKVNSKVFSLKGYEVQEMPSMFAGRSAASGQ